MCGDVCQYKVSLFCLTLHVILCYSEKSNSLTCLQIVFFFPECRFVNIALFKKKSLLRDREKEYSIGFVYLLCIFINFHIIEKAPQREGEKKNVTASR